MARIRSIKPDFWTDDALTECSIAARLLFIGTWNFADDNGNLDRSSKQLKFKIFPSDNIDTEKLIRELLSKNLLREYIVDGKKYLNIRTFLEHQVINKPSKSRIPLCDECCNTTVVIPEEDGSTTNGREGKGEEGKGREVSAKLRYSDLVTLTEKEYSQLIEKYGEEATKWMVEKLSAHKESKGTKYKSDAGAIRSWVVDSWMEHQNKVVRMTPKHDPRKAVM
jgi:hypothetical protein